MAGLMMTHWAGLVVPGATLSAVITCLNAELVRELFTALGASAKPSTPEEFVSLLRVDPVRFAKIVLPAGVNID